MALLAIYQFNYKSEESSLFWLELSIEILTQYWPKQCMGYHCQDSTIQVLSLNALDWKEDAALLKSITQLIVEQNSGPDTATLNEE